MKGNRDLAIADFREAIRLNPTNSTLSRNALELLGEPTTAPGAPQRGVLDLLK